MILPKKTLNNERASQIHTFLILLKKNVLFLNKYKYINKYFLINSKKQTLNKTLQIIEIRNKIKKKKNISSLNNLILFTN